MARKLTAREAFSPTRSWRVDKTGKWRDGRGRFVPKARVIGRVRGLLDTDQMAMMLRDAARGVPRELTDAYFVRVEFEGVGWRTLGNAHGLKRSLTQAASFVEEKLELRLGKYVRDRDPSSRKLYRRGERPEPRIRDIEIVRIRDEDSKPRRKRKKRRAK